MRFETSIEYPADVEAVAAMLADEDFARRRVEAAGASRSQVTVTREGTAFTVSTRATMPSTRVPQAFRSFVGAELEVRITEEWGAAGADGSRSSVFGMSISGVPVTVRGAQHLMSIPAGALERYSGEVTASVPLFGRRIEQMAVAAVEEVVAAERRLGLEHLGAA